MSIADDIAFLERIPLLRQLGSSALRIVAIGVEAYRLDAGQRLFAAGDLADCAYIVQQGSFVLKPERKGSADVIAGPGTLLGECALIAEIYRPATATARENSTVLRIPRAMFLKMLDSYPEAARRLRDVMAGRVDDWARDLENIRTVVTRKPREPT
jgi:CRP-like cAMP-binding protein